MPFDYKKEYRKFYMPPKKPGIVEVPSMNYIAVSGKGDPMKKMVSIRQLLACFMVLLLP